MLFQHPIYPLVIAVFILILVVMLSLQNQKVFKFLLSLAFLNVAFFTIAFVLYEDTLIGNTTYEHAYIGITFYVYAFFLMMLYQIFRSSTLKANHYQLFVKSIKNSRWNAFYVVDKKERIRDMSQSLLVEIGMDKEDIIGKKLFQVLNKSVRFTRRNNIDMNNRQLESYYLNYKNEAKPGDEEVEEVHFLNESGDPVLLHMVMQPVFSLGKYKGRICIGEKKTDFNVLAIEKELNERNVELESIRHKFIATLDLSEEGLFYIDLDERTLWASDSLVKTLDLPGNLIDLTDFRRLIEAEDLKKYLAILGDLTVNKNQYQTSYRIRVGHQYLWFREKGKRLFEDTSGAIIMGTLNQMKTKHFQASHIDILDGLKDKNEFIAHLHQLFTSSRYFQLVVFKLQNIPKINEDHGREVGNMFMAEYIKKMKESFVSESSDIFRINGIEFAMTVTDPRKIEMLESGIQTNATYLNLSMVYGSISETLEVFSGIAIGGSDAHDEHQLYQAAFQALKIALNPQFSGHHCYYKDIVT